MEKVRIIGCGGHARSVADVLIDNQEDISLVFFDKNAKSDEKILERNGVGYPVYPISQINIDDCDYFFAIGDNKCRQDIVKKLDLAGMATTIISNKSYVSKYADIGCGVFVAEGAHIGPDAKVGNYTIINTSAVIEHEVSVGDFSHISVNSTVCGRCSIGNNVFIGAGAVVKDKLSICDNVIVGANAVVIKDIVIPGTYVGNPLRKIK